MIRRLVVYWFTCVDSNRPSGRSWARQLGISHTWLQKLIRELKKDPVEMRRLQAYGDPKPEQLDRARESTRRMREQGELRRPALRRDKGLEERMKKAVLGHLDGQAHGVTERAIAMAIHVWPCRILRLLRRYDRLGLIRGRRRAWRPMVWETTPHGRAWLARLGRQVARAA